MSQHGFTVNISNLQAGCFTDANHSVFTVGPTVQAALKAAVMLEEAAQTMHYAMQRGTVTELPEDVISKAFKFYKEKYGQKSKDE